MSHRAVGLGRDLVDGADAPVCRSCVKVDGLSTGATRHRVGGLEVRFTARPIAWRELRWREPRRGW